MLLLAFLVLLGTILAAEPVHLKVGALSAHLVRAFLVEDILLVSFSTMVEVPTNLTVITKQLNDALSQLEDNFPEEVGSSADFLPLLHVRVTYLNDPLTFALENYNGITLVKRTKRGLINCIGQLFHMMFGTAMNEDLVELRKKLN